MAKKYRQPARIPGKFYVSEGWKAADAGGDGTHSQHDHTKHLADMILAGPFDTRNEAETWNTDNANGHADVWQLC